MALHGSDGLDADRTDKQQKPHRLEIDPRLADAINARRKRNNSELLFPNGNGKPNQHLLRDLQSLAKRAGAKFHTVLHKLRKTGASRRYRARVPLNRYTRATRVRKGQPRLKNY